MPSAHSGTNRTTAWTTTAILNTKTGETMGVIPKDSAAPARDAAIGKAQGEAVGAAQTNLPGAEAKAEQAGALIDSILYAPGEPGSPNAPKAVNPALAGITGMFQGRMPPWTQAGTDLNVKIQQLQGKAFLDAFDSLKGGGAITELEGAKAEQAMARLNRAQSTEAFTDALEELRGIIASGVERMRSRTGGAAPTGQPAPAATSASSVPSWSFAD